MDNDSIRKNLLKLRKQHGYNQQTLADAIGKVRNTYIALEQGPTEIVSKHLFKIAEFYNIAPEELLFGYMPDRPGVNGLMSTRDYESLLSSIRQEHLKEIETLENRIKDLEEKLDNRDKLEAYLLTLLPKND